MKSNNSFGVHFVLRTQRTLPDGKIPICARITVNRTRCELTVKHSVFKSDWNTGKGAAKPKPKNSGSSTLICRNFRARYTGITAI